MAKRTKKRYVGPAYHKGIRLPGYDHDIRPADFSAVQVAEFIRQHPQYADWWEEEPPAPPPPPVSE